MAIITKTADDRYQVTQRGVDYSLRLDPLGRWEVWSRRQALGRLNTGTIRHFASLREVSAECAAFAGVHILADLPTGVAA